MAEIRLSKLTKQFSIGLARLVDFLNEKGANVEMNPNAKISDEYLPAIEAKFGEDQKLKKDSEKVTIKLKEIIELGAKKKPSQEEEEVPEKEVVIKSNALNEERPVEAAPAVKPAPAPAEPAKVTAGPKVIDKIDLSQFEKKAPKAEEKPAPAPEPTPAPAPVEKPVEEPKPEPAPQPEPAPTPAEETVKPVAEVREVKVEVEKLAGPKVVDKIDLSQFDKKKKKKKRERIGKDGGSQKVDVTKVEASNNAGKKDNGNNNNKNNSKNHPANAQQAGGKKDKKNRRDRGGDKFKPMTEAEQEEMQKEIQKQIKETYARMNEGKKGNFGAKHRKEKRELASQRMQEEMEMQELEQKVLKVTEFVTVNDLATLMNNTPVTKVIGACMSLGMMVSINQRLDAETLVLVAEACRPLVLISKERTARLDGVHPIDLRIEPSLRLALCLRA